jgi:hypothetical protein
MKELTKIMGIVTAVLVLGTGVFGDIVQLPLNCAGTYDINTPAWTSNFDLGVTFSEISHVYIDWSGEITAGLAIYYSDPCNPFPLEVGIYAGFYPPFRFAEIWGGEESYPAPEPFDSISEIKPSTWLDLLDGEGTIIIQYEELAWAFEVYGGKYIEHGSVMLNDATLIVEGTVIPEPTTILLLSLGASLMVKMRRSRTSR